MDVNQVKVTMTVGEINQMLTELGEAPMKYVINVVDRLRNAASSAVRLEEAKEMAKKVEATQAEAGPARS